MGKIIKLKNNVYLDSSSVTKICNTGKYLKLTNNTNQIVQANTVTEVNWQTVSEDTSEGLLTKIGNKIKIGKGINNVFVHCQFRDNQSESAGIVYIVKNGENCSVNILNSQMITHSDIIPVEEDDEISINVYETGAARTITGGNYDAWEYFKVVVLN